MYFKQSDIQAAKKYITERSTKLKVVIGATDEVRFNRTIGNILKQKEYYEGEQIDPKHMTALKTNVNIIIENLSEYLVKNADTLKDTTDLSNPVEYLATAVDGLYIRAMQQLGCPNMALFHFDPNIKNTLTNSAMTIHRAFVKYDVSRDDAFKQQRGKDAAEVSKDFGLIVEGIKKGKKAESMGKMIAEYQALKDRQKNHNGFWRFFHRTENKDRNALIEKMGKFIRDQLPEGMKKINLDEVIPAVVSRDIADALIRGEVEVAGPRRLDPTTATQVFGCSPVNEEIANQ
ncbi:MAG: hypothetical protein J6Q78_02885 [Clostridia bacterium]|nr:hypothetical protein [Clostridia bacterium]